MYIHTLTGHFIRYTLLVPGWTPFCLQRLFELLLPLDGTNSRVCSVGADSRGRSGGADSRGTQVALTLGGARVALTLRALGWR